MSPVKNPKRLFFCFNMKFSMCIDHTRKISEFPPWGKGEKEGERIPIAFINPNFQPFLPLGLVAEVAERPTHKRMVPGSNTVGIHDFFSFFLYSIYL